MLSFMLALFFVLILSLMMGKKIANKHICRAVVIGETALCIECCKRLISSGWSLLLVVSSDKLIIKWCQNAGIKCVPYSELDRVQYRNFFLFSIVNPLIVTQDFLKKHKVKLAINYHDSLLPHYAGLNSTTWAILNNENENEHGITWHTINDGIDEGDLILQKKIAIDKKETAYSLNVKCAEEALSSFSELLELLSSNNQNVIKQDLSHRTYFGRKALPKNYGVIRQVDKPAKIKRYWRGLYFADGHDNPVATEKVLIGDKLYIVSELDDFLSTVSHKAEFCAGIKNIYGESIDSKKIPLANEPSDKSFKLTRNELDLLSVIKQREKKCKYRLESYLKISGAVFDAPLTEHHAGLVLCKEIKLNGLLAIQQLAAIMLVLLRIFNKEFSVTCYESMKVGWRLKKLLDKKIILNLAPSLLSNTLIEFQQCIETLAADKLTITKDFFYRYNLMNLLTDIGIYFGDDTEPFPFKHRLIFKIKNDLVQLYGLEEDKSIIHAIMSSLKEVATFYKANLKTKSGKINLLPEYLYKQIIFEWNKTEKTYPKGRVIDELFQEQANKFPKKIAVDFEGQRLTFEQLNERSNSLAQCIRSQWGNGFPTNILIPLCVIRSIEMIVGILAILKSGAAYVPIDPNYPDRQIKHILKDTNSQLVLTQSSLISKLNNLTSGKNPKLIAIDQSRHLKKGFKLPIKHNPSDLAYVIYTSGTSGIPKGVMVSHSACLKTIFSRLSDNHKRTSFWTNYVFDVSVFEIFSGFLKGATVCIAPESCRLDAGIFIKWLIENDIEYAYIPPHFIKEISTADLPSLKSVLIGVEPVIYEDVHSFISKGIKVINAYGLTETAICNTALIIDKQVSIKNKADRLPIGNALENNKLYVLNEYLSPTPIGVVGELYVAGSGLAEGYLNHPKLNKQRFMKNPFTTTLDRKNGYDRLFKTGDLVKWLPDGNLLYIGRNDFQIKLSGYRIELPAIEKFVLGYKGIKRACVLVKDEKYLVVYYIADNEVDHEILIQRLSANLPSQMVPKIFIHMTEFPMTTNDKLDIKTLLKQPLPTQVELQQLVPKNNIEESLLSVWKKLLGRKTVGTEDNFFDLGGNSLLAIQLVKEINQKLDAHLSPLDIFSYPSINMLAKKLSDNVDESSKFSERGVMKQSVNEDNDIAIIGLACHFPGSKNANQFWLNLVEGNEGIQFFSEENLQSTGTKMQESGDGKYVPAKGFLDNYDHFDANFFGISPRDAKIFDPQQRIFLEEAFHALEDAGCDPFRYEGAIGIYAGSGSNDYLQLVLQNNRLHSSANEYQIRTHNLADFLTSRVAYHLNLKGPAVTVQTACSTSLVAIDSACNELKAGKCNIALAGGVSLTGGFGKSGYYYQHGMIYSPDAHCRPFDEKAEGTVPSQGVGVVVLKPLKKAIADGDNIHAIIKGSSTNNDGSLKVGYTSPGVQGQVQVIQQAMKNASVNPDSIGYVEAHGTATSIGDPIEVTALQQAFHSQNESTEGKKQYCALGSVKSNIGHTDAAAGVAGFIKAILCLEHKMLVPTLHYKKSNPKINFDDSPFYINTETKYWDNTGSHPRRAGVSSFGIGGTNAHIILEESTNFRTECRSKREFHVLPFSAKTYTSVSNSINQLAEYLEKNPKIDLADLAYTLQQGRVQFDFRSVCVVRSADELIGKLKDNAIIPIKMKAHSKIGFMFSGQGSQYLNMAREIYQSEPVFRQQFDYCVSFLKEKVDLDIYKAIYTDNRSNYAEECLNETAVTQPAIFSVEYALCKLWQNWGVQPDYMIGHSIGEYTAACLAGVFSLDDALLLVAERGRLIQSMPKGSMLAVSISEENIKPYLNKQLDIAAINGSSQIVLSGKGNAIITVQEKLSRSGIQSIKLKTSHAFHSALLDPILKKFSDIVSSINLNAPKIPFVSNLTGDWITNEQATDPQYWAKQIRNPVRFHKGLNKISAEDEQVLLEVGPGKVLMDLAKNYFFNATKSVRILNSLPYYKERIASNELILNTLGQLWTFGVKINWENIYTKEQRRRLSLPGYPFERQVHWVDNVNSQESRNKIFDFMVDDWLYQPVWRVSNTVPNSLPEITSKFLVFEDEEQTFGSFFIGLFKTSSSLIRVKAGDRFLRKKENLYTINRFDQQDYKNLVQALKESNNFPEKIIHLWNIEVDKSGNPLDDLDNVLSCSYDSIFYLIKALSGVKIDRPIEIYFVSLGMQTVFGEPLLNSISATIVGAIQVVEQEYPNIKCCSVDIDSITISSAEKLVLEIKNGISNKVIAYRNNNRYIKDYTQIKLSRFSELNMPLKTGGVYFVTGGLGGIGLTLATYLAKAVQAKLILVGRSSFPKRLMWNKWLKVHDKNDITSEKIRAIQQIEKLGSKVIVDSIDIASFEQTKAYLDKIRKKHGELNGVIHSAGVADGVLIAMSNKKTSDAVLSSKIKGTLVLDQVLSGNHLDFFILCSSLASIVGEAGQLAYSAANSFLDAYAYQKRQEGKNVITINWDVWKEIGMAVNLARDPGLIADRVSTADVHRQTIDHFLFSYGEKLQGDGYKYYAQLSAKDTWFINEHKIEGRFTLPGTAYLMFVKSAFELLSANRSISVQISDVYFLSPLTFDANESKKICVSFRRELDSESYSFVISSQTNTANWGDHCSGRIQPLQRKESLQDKKLLSEKLSNVDQSFKSKLQKNFGPRWQNLKKCSVNQNKGLAVLELPKRFLNDLDKFKLHPALLDVAIGWLSIYFSLDGYLPFSYKQLTIVDDLPSSFFSYVTYLDDRSSSNEKRFDITLLDKQGNTIIYIEEFAMRRMNIRATFQGKSTEKSIGHFDSSEKIEEQDIFLPKNGISVDEGVEIFRCALSSNQAQIIVSTTNLNERLKNSDNLLKITSQEANNTFHQRKLNVDYVSAKSELEKKLVDIWQRFFSISPIGIKDDFFDLGGSSLLAIQLINNINQDLHLQLPLHIIISYSTIASLVQYIKGEGDNAEDTTLPFSVITIQKGASNKKPLFMMHPAGGSVYLYRDLATALGKDQPLYGIQAQSIILDSSGSILSVQGMASAYITAIQEIQPDGPYYLGGASFGGTLAFEMAQQLKAKNHSVAMLAMIDTNIVEKMPLSDIVDYTMNVDQRNNFDELYIAHAKVMCKYKPRPYQGNIIFFRATVRDNKNFSNLYLGWLDVAKEGVEMIDVEGDHFTVNQLPNVMTVADRLKEELRKN